MKPYKLSSYLLPKVVKKYYHFSGKVNLPLDKSFLKLYYLYRHLDNYASLKNNIVVERIYE